MRIAHIGDIHININSTRLGKISSAPKVRENRLKIFNYTLSMAVKDNVDLIILAGDIFDKSQPYPQDYQDLIEALEIVENTPIFMINGNHDEITSKGCGLEVIDLPSIFTKPTIFNDKDLDHSFILCPWGTPMDFIKRSIEECHFEAIVILHGGVRSESHSWVEVDGEQGNYSLKELEECGAKAIMLSHFHGQKMLAPHIWYAGSPDNVHGFGEENDEKGFLIWDIDKEVSVKQYSTNDMVDIFQTIDPHTFLNLTDFEGGYLRIKGEVNEKERLDIIKALKDFKCLDYKLDLTSIQKKIKVDTLTGKNEQEVLKNYFKKKGIKHEKELLKLDKEMGI